LQQNPVKENTVAETINFGALKITIEKGPDSVTYTFDGDVDENFRHADVPRHAARQINFILENVNNFNSVGIREWVYLVRDLSSMGQMCFKRCSVTMIDQINMVPDSLGNGVVESFFAPYACDDHGETSRLIVTRDHASQIRNHVAPEMHCETCRKKLVFDALEDAYFMFVSGNISKAS
jgi:hypothetical protein